jgi:glycerol uptake facilitator-like aquaporin
MNGSRIRRALEEVAGTAILVGIGIGTIVGGQRVGYLPITVLALGWFLAVLVPVLLFARGSGAHLNPAVTTGLAASGRLPWREWPLYVGSQLVGAFLGTIVVLATLGRGVRLGATVPSAGYLSYLFPVELAGTALLVLTVFLIADLGEGAYRWRLFLPALVVGVLTFIAGPLTGVSLNPARSIAPAVLAGVYDDLWIYLIAQPLAALVVAAVWRPGLLDRWGRQVDVPSGQ